jgi:hypothetical protein
VVGAVILAIVPYGPWLLVPFGVFAALLPFARTRNFGLVATFLTPLVVLLIDLLEPSGWRLAEDRLIDTVLASAVVLVVGYAPWPSAWQAHLPGQFAEAVRAVCAYMDEALVPAPDDEAAQDLAGTPAGVGTGAGTGLVQGAGAVAEGPANVPATPRDGLAPWPSLLRRRAFRGLSNMRTEFQRTMSEPTAVSRRASAWWPALVGLEEVMDAVTATAVAIGRGATPPSPAAVHQLTGALRSVADAIESGTLPRPADPLPADRQLEPVTDAVRSVLSMLTPGGGDATRGEPAVLAPA